MKRANPQTATYLYCVIESRQAPSLGGAPRGLPGAGRPRLLEALPSLWLAAGDAPLAGYGQPAIEAGLHDLDWVARCAVAHERVVEHFARTATVIPMKLFTLFTSDDRAVAHIHKMRKKLENVLRGVSGCQEWGVRIRWKGASPPPIKRRAPAPKAAKSVPLGTRFLLARKEQQDRERLMRQRAVRDAETVYHSLARSGKASVRLALAPATGGGRVILDAAFLVSRKGQARFHTAVQRATQRFQGGYDVVLSGPWPPYNFIAGWK